jgi:hypothetical protein
MKNMYKYPDAAPEMTPLRNLAQPIPGETVGTPYSMVESAAPETQLTT